MLAKTPRSGFFFLGSGKQSVAEHINRVCFIGFTLSRMDKSVDSAKVINMCLFHDVSESRISDLNYVHQKYTERKEKEAISDLARSLPFGSDIEEIVSEYEERQSKEAKFAKDADNIELILSLKEQADIGNERAKSWIPSAKARLLTDEAKKLVDVIVETDSDEWWFGDKDDKWWVSRSK